MPVAGITGNNNTPEYIVVVLLGINTVLEMRTLH
jgi:hypothetical protein